LLYDRAAMSLQPCSRRNLRGRAGLAAGALAGLMWLAHPAPAPDAQPADDGQWVRAAKDYAATQIGRAHV